MHKQVTNNTANSPGLAVGTCLNHGLYSDSTLVTTTPDFTKFFSGKLATDDFINPSDFFGSALFIGINDWVSFDSQYRAWGVDGNAFPSADNRGACISGSCCVWDYRLIADAANIAFNSSENVTSKNDLFIPGSNCPSAVNGNRVTTYVDLLTRPKVFGLN